MSPSDSPIHLSAELLNRAETAARREGLTVPEWIARLVLRETGEEAGPRMVGPEDEVRGGPESTERPAVQMDD